MSRLTLPQFSLSPLAIGFLIAGCFSLSALAQTPLGQGGEFVVNTYTAGAQEYPAVAVTPDGTFVVAWESDLQDGDGSGIFMQRLDNTGTPIGSEQQVNTTTTGSQSDADIAVFDDDSFVIVWDDGTDIFAQRFDAMGQAQGAELAVNSTLVADQNDPVVASAPDGSFMVAWEITQVGDFEDIIARRFDAAGMAIGSEIAVNATTVNDQEDVDIDSDAAGNFVVVWESEGQDGSYDSVVGRRFDTAGSAIGGEFQVNSYITGDQDTPFLAVHADGSFAVTWEDDTQDNFIDGIYARYFNADATPASDEFQVDQATGREMNPRIALDSDGEAVITWDALMPPNFLEVMYNSFDASGIAKGPEQLVNTTSMNDQVLPALALGSDNRGLVAWIDDNGLDGNAAGIAARLFDVTLFTDGFESGDLDAWTTSAP